MGWGGNTDASPIIDIGQACRYKVKYTSKGETRTKEAHRRLIRLVRYAHE